MPISSSTDAQVEAQTSVAVESTARLGKSEPRRRSLRSAGEESRATVAQGANALYSYPWLLERISQTFFREWIGRHLVPTKIDHTDWLCTVCQNYSATWETRSGSYCKYCWTMSRLAPAKVPQYMLEMIRFD